MSARHKAKSVAAPLHGKAYAVYWSIYTDLPGRVPFRRLYWDRLKDAIGRPAKLVGISREVLWPSGLPSHELRAEAWRFACAGSTFDIVADTLDAAFRVAPRWRLLTAPNESDEVLELIWDRPAAAVDASPLPFSSLTSILVVIRADTGFGIRPGCILRNGERSKRSFKVPLIAAAPPQGSLVVDWHMHVQTSTKRQLMETHWPPLQARFGGDAELVELEKRSGDTGPFRFLVRQTLAGITAAEAMVATLTNAGGLDLEQIERSETVVRLRGSKGSVPPGRASAILGFEANWHAETSPS